MCHMHWGIQMHVTFKSQIRVPQKGLSWSLPPKDWRKHFLAPSAPTGHTSHEHPDQSHEWENARPQHSTFWSQHQSCCLARSKIAKRCQKAVAKAHLNWAGSKNGVKKQHCRMHVTICQGEDVLPRWVWHLLPSHWLKKMLPPEPWKFCYRRRSSNCPTHPRAYGYQKTLLLTPGFWTLIWTIKHHLKKGLFLWSIEAVFSCLDGLSQGFA